MEFSLDEAQQVTQQVAATVMPKPDGVPVPGDPSDTSRWRQIAEADLLGLPLREDVGGSGFGMMEVALVLEQRGRSLAPVPLLETMIAALVVDRFGSDELRAGLLPAVIAGRATLALALVGLGASGAGDPSTAVRRAAGGVSITGGACCVGYAADARWILLPARDDDGRGVIGLLGPDDPGVALTPLVTTDGHPEYELVVDDAFVPASRVLSSADLDVGLWAWEHAVVGLSAEMVGVAAQALADTAAYVTERQQFGRPIGAFQAVAMRLADCFIDVEAMRTTAWEAAWRLAEGRPASAAVSVAKYWAATGGQRVVAAAQHLHGGMGVDVTYPLHRYTLTAKRLELSLGGADWHAVRLGQMPAEPVAAR